MNSEQGDFLWDPSASISTYTYDAHGSVVTDQPPPRVSALGSDGHALDPDELERRLAAARAAAKKQRQPILTHTFEFRLSGSETREQWLALPEGSFRLADSVLAMRSVRASLARNGKVAASAINGVEVDAELRPTGVFCTAKLSDFGDGDMVVVRVDVSLY